MERGDASKRDGASAGAPLDGSARDTWPPSPVVGRVLSALLGADCVVAIPAILLDSSPGARKGLALALVCSGLVGAAALLWRGRRPGFERGRFHVALIVALGVITTAVWCGNGGATAVAAMGFFASPPLFAFAFFPWRQAVPYLLAASALSVVVVVVTVHQTPVACSLAAVGTAVVAALTAGYLRSLLMRSSATDSLTGLPNRQALAGLLEREATRAERLGTTLAVAIVDLDNFKEVNDSGGHKAGDDLLRRVASHWRRQLRLQDELVRYGGDEFVVVLPGCDAGRGAAVVDALRRSGERPCSIGIAQWLPGDSVDVVLAEADAALYEAKRQGRDRVVTASPGDEPGPGHLLSAPPLRRWRPAVRIPTVVMGRPDAVVQTEVLAALFVAGSVATLPGLLVDPIPHVPVQLARTMAAGAAVIGIAMLLAARRLGTRLPMTVVHGGIVLAIGAVCCGCMLAHGGFNGIVSLGIMAWVAMYVTVFFPWRVAVAYVAFGAAAVVVEVMTTVRSNPVGVSLLEVCSMMGAGCVVGYLALMLHRQAHVDALTRLPNRRALDGILDREVAMAARSGSPLCVAVIDLDHLKSVNDTRGHLAGDQALRDFADHWRTRLRTTDSLVRQGGDEFVLLLPGCDLPAAAVTLERLQATGAPPCSVGVTQWLPPDTGEALLARADAALYRAKAQGRNQVMSLCAG